MKKLFTFALAFLLACPPTLALAAVTYDTAASGTADDVTNLSFPKTNTGSNLSLFVCISHRTTITGVTYNGVALTQVGTTLTADSRSLDMWHLIAPASGAHNVVISSSAGIFGHAVALSFTGVHQTVPLGTPATADGEFGAPRTVTVTGVANGMVVDCMTIEDSTPTVGGGQTERYHVAYWQHLASSTSVATGSVGMTWTFADDYNAAIAVPILPAAAARRVAPILIQ
jgi:hypothetical protein